MKKSNFMLNEDGQLFIRASQIARIMTNGKKKGELSKGGQTYVKDLWKQHHYGYRESFSGKEMDKGTFMEDVAIEMVAKMHDQPYKKNEVTMTNGYIKGTCDIDGGDHIRDIKCSWSKKTFPVFPEDGRNSAYEWQLKAYMMLYDRDRAYLDYCLVETPETLVPDWEPSDLHDLSGLEDKMKVTTIEIFRNDKDEAMMIEKVKQARQYWEYLNKLKFEL